MKDLFDFSDEPPPPPNHTFLDRALAVIGKHPGQFRDGFDEWVRANHNIARAFEREALRVAATGRRHYSAHTIIEYMRHYTWLQDQTSEWKVNEAWTSSIARLFAHMNRRHVDLLEFRNRKNGVVGPLAFEDAQ